LKIVSYLSLGQGS